MTTTTKLLGRQVSSFAPISLLVVVVVVLIVVVVVLLAPLGLLPPLPVS